MSAQGAKTPGIVAKGTETAVQEAVKVLNRYQVEHTTVRRWVCEVCGMVHTGTAPEKCESCGSSIALVQQADVCREMGSRW